MQVLLLLLVATTATAIQQPRRGPPSASEFITCLKTQNPSNPIPLYTPQNAAFNSTLQSYIQNSRFNRSTTPKPVAIIAPTSYTHVQATVVCSQVSGIELRIRSGGHDNEGMSYVSPDPFVVLDMNGLREVRVDVAAEVAWAQSGANLGELYYRVANESNDTLAFPAGVCLTLGTGGHISGGGYGALMRKFGLASDNVLDAEVVDAKGRILNRSTMGEDLFWAIRGGGGGASFAVVLSWKLQLVRVPKTVTVFSVMRTMEEGAADILYEWQRVAYSADRNLFLRAQPQATLDAANKTTVGVTFIALYLGGAKHLLTLLNSTFPLLGLKLQDCQEMTWLRSNMFWAELPKDTPVEHMLTRSSARPNNYHKNKSDYVKSFIPKKGWEDILKKLKEVGPSMRMQYNPYGGRMGEIAEDATPFPHRAGTLFKMQYIMVWPDPSLEADYKYIQITRELHKAFTPYVSHNPREAFLNYRDIDVGTKFDGLGFAYDFFKGNVERMLKVKDDVDPLNLFRYEQSIPILNKV